MKQKLLILLLTLILANSTYAEMGYGNVIHVKCLGSKTIIKVNHKKVSLTQLRILLKKSNNKKLRAQIKLAIQKALTCPTLINTPTPTPVNTPTITPTQTPMPLRCGINHSYREKARALWGVGIPRSDTSRYVSTVKAGLERTLVSRLKKNDIYAIYDVQVATKSFLEMSIRCNDIDALSEIAELYLAAYRDSDNHAVIFPVRATQTYPLDAYIGWKCTIPYDSVTKSGCTLYSNPSYKDKDNYLISMQFLSSIGDLLRSTILLADNVGTPLWEFHNVYRSVWKEHLQKWIYDLKDFSVKGWGCTDTANYNHNTFILRKRARLLGTNIEYCNAMVDVDWHFAKSVIDYLDAHIEDPVGFALPAPKNGDQDFKHYVQSLLLLYKERFTKGTGWTANMPRYTIEDPVWRTHPAYKYSNWNEEDPIPDQFPFESISPASGSWDISHAGRNVELLMTLIESPTIHLDPLYKSVWGSGIATYFAKGFINQIAVHLKTDQASGLVTHGNYLDGSGGWYKLECAKGATTHQCLRCKVDAATNKCARDANGKIIFNTTGAIYAITGVPPKSLSAALLFMGYPSLVPYSDDTSLKGKIGALVKAVEAVKAGTASSQISEIIRKYYLIGGYSYNRDTIDEDPRHPPIAPSSSQMFKMYSSLLDIP